MNEFSQCGASEPFALRVIGDDMAPEFVDGNIVVVDPGGVVRDGCYVIVRLGDETVLRQLRVIDGRYRLASTLSSPEVAIEEQDIVGVVSQKAGRRRHERKRYDL